MKRRSIIASIISLFAAPSLASAPPKKTCLLCKEEIKNNDGVSHIYHGGEMIPVHFACNWQKEWNKLLVTRSKK